MLTVRDHVRSIHREVLAGHLRPERSRELLLMLTALFGNCQEAETAAYSAYVVVLDSCLSEESKANRARIRAERSVEYAAWQEARNARVLVDKLAINLKAVIRSQDEEMRLAR